QYSNGAYMGIYTKDLTLPEARELGYEKWYGVLVQGVTKDSPAHFFKILEDDIIMQIDGRKVMDKAHLNKLLNLYNTGDQITLKLFRMNEEIDIPFVFGARDSKFTIENDSLKIIQTSKVEKTKNGKKKLTTGHGGASWIPVWFVPDLEDVNNLISDFSFSELDDSGILMNGLGGKGNIGKDWYLGGYGVWYSKDVKRGYDLDDDDNNDVIRRMLFKTSYGGVTLDKRYALSNKFITSIGFMLGWGGYDLEINQTNGNYDWTNANSQLEDSDNNSLMFTKNYILLQPKVSLMYRVNSWLGFRAEAGYMLSYSYHNGWNADLCDDVYEVDNSPNTSFEGLTISIGPWFGF
ncbi:MAG: PDZ domain-containing protein, partial [Candidatus Cloacimonadota bacterium]|nr:PDZ domain-containing protein [Candidatus Cloacimonadota bacterium]